MARNVLLVSVGILLGVVGGAAFNLHADEPSRDIHEAAAAAQVDPVDLAGAVNTTGLDPWLYLRGVGELASPPSPSPRVVDPPPGVWDVLARCESTSNWSAATGNGFFGGLQFDLPTWRAYGGVGMPNLASRAEQIRVAERLHSARGFAPWPACSRRLGLR